MSQSTESSVCAICLTADRHEMTRMAVESFRAQTYANKRLLIWDTGTAGDNCFGWGPELQHVCADPLPTIGEIRNAAARFHQDYGQPEILIHWDSDDYSHPNRIAEQVQLLQSSGADCVGYREMLFWREPVTKKWEHLEYDNIIESESVTPGEAWLYSCPKEDYALGTSLCYWRKTWERKPFEATSQGEEERWLRGMKVVSGSSLGHPARSIGPGSIHYADDAPRMIARIHATNTSTAYAPHKMARAAEWRRVPKWDSFCAETM